MQKCLEHTDPMVSDELHVPNSYALETTNTDVGMRACPGSSISLCSKNILSHKVDVFLVQLPQNPVIYGVRMRQGSSA